MNAFLKTISLSVLWIVIGGVMAVVLSESGIFLPHDVTLALIALLGLFGLGATKLIAQARA